MKLKSLSLRRILPAAILLAIPVDAAVIGIGNLSILADSPDPGLQELTISNATGNGNCSIDYEACSNIDFTGWTLTVNYTSSFYSDSGITFTDGSGGYTDITPGSSSVFDFDLCGGVNIDSNCTPATTITGIVFSGFISPASFCLFDATANGCPAAPVTFFANPSFTLKWDSGSTQSPYVDENSVYAVSPDITVSDTSPTPEPGSLSLLGIAVAMAIPKCFRASGKR